MVPGAPGSPDAPTGSQLPSDAYVDLNSLMAQIQNITPQAQPLLASLNDRVVELKVTVDRVNDLLSAENRSEHFPRCWRIRAASFKRIVPN